MTQIFMVTLKFFNNSRYSSDGDLTLSDGSITITDADNATSLALTNNTITSASLADINSSSLTHQEKF